MSEPLLAVIGVLTNRYILSLHKMFLRVKPSGEAESFHQMEKVVARDLFSRRGCNGVKVVSFQRTD